MFKLSRPEKGVIKGGGKTSLNFSKNIFSPVSLLWGVTPCIKHPGEQFELKAGGKLPSSLLGALKDR